MNVIVSIVLYSIVLTSCVMSGMFEVAHAEEAEKANIFQGTFRWTTGAPVIEPAIIDGEEWLSVKDPSFVQYGGKWHLFCTVRGTKRSHAVIYLTFTEWDSAVTAKQQVLRCHKGYFCAPQVFYFEPHRKWYLICQASDDSWTPKYGAAYSTTDNISDPGSWSPLTPLGHRQADGKSGLDFWIICDEAKAHLFFTTLDGRMWREETSLEDFPAGWSEPELAVEADIFEASHIYKLKGHSSYLALIEAQHGNGWRYFKAYLAGNLEGQWTPLAAGKDAAFASMLNVSHTAGRWTDVISHGELFRAGCDQRLEVNPAGLRFLYQGVTDEARKGKKYGEIPWRLGILESIR